MAISINDDWVKAIVIADPTKGAVQGVANNVAKKPLKKFFEKKPSPRLKILLLLKKVGNLISNKPKVFSEKMVNTNKIINKK